MSASSPAVMRSEPRPSWLALWFGFLGGAMAWSIQLVVGYAVVAYSCFPLDAPVAAPSIGATRGLTIALTVVALTVAAGSLAVAVRNWRARRPARAGGWRAEIAAAERARADRFLAFSGVLFGILFTALIVYNLASLLMLPTCSR